MDEWHTIREARNGGVSTVKAKAKKVSDDKGCKDDVFGV